MVIQAGTEGGARVAEAPPEVLPRVGAMIDKEGESGDGTHMERERSSFFSCRRSDRGGEGMNPGNNLHVSGLSSRVDNRELEAAFSKFGKVNS